MNRSFLQKVAGAWRQAKESWRNDHTEDRGFPDWADEARPAAAPAGQMRPPTLDDFDPETFTKETLAFREGESRNAAWLIREIKEGRAVVDRGWVYEARCDRAGRILREARGDSRLPYRLSPIRGHDSYLAHQARSDRMERFRETAFGAELSDRFDPAQYTEYAPLMGGYFFAQQYLTDQLKGFAYAFEAWNHNPLAHRIINALSQYTLGRRFTWHIKDEKKEKAWEEFAERIQLRQRLSKFWLREKLIFGEMMLDVKKWRTIHPATVWEIVTDPDDFSEVYYYYRSYPTAYQMFTGYAVPGVPGSKDARAQKYVVEQIPAPQILHTKSQCTSFEKRGRSSLFPVLGWLKRIKDIYNNQAIREQMLADYVWDVEIDGGPGDVAKYAAQYTPLARPGSTHFHNKAVKREPMAIPAGSATGSGEASNNILSFIATAIGLPKEFFNVIAANGGNRATALVSAEPFTKVIEDEQADVEYLLQRMARVVFEQAGLGYRPDDVEFTFPSVAKDTTSETVKNIVLGESQGYISKERAATLYTQEMNITAYDFDDEVKRIKEEGDKGISGMGMPPPPEGRMGGDDGTVHDGDNPLHGAPRSNTKDQLNTL